MNLSRRKTNQGIELIVRGRLDAYWADHLSQEITTIMHSGVHHLSLQLGEVQYISSAGIRVLLKFHKQLKRIGGSLSVCEPSAIVMSVIELTGLKELLIGREPVQIVSEAVDAGDGLSIVRTTLDPAGYFSCRLLGNPNPFPGDGFTHARSHGVSVNEGSFGLGLGALGADYEECAARFGEWLMVHGAAAYLPSDQTAMPDYAISAGSYRPVSQLLYGIICAGNPAWQIKFEAGSQRDAVSLSEILVETFAPIKGDSMGIMLVAETASLVGVSLRKSPTAPLRGQVPLAHPDIREWLTFTPERAYPETVTLVVGVVSRRPSAELAGWLRPHGPNSGLYAHLHAAVFSYSPLRQSSIHLSETVRGLFEQQHLQGLLHLVKDDRPIHGAGESEFTRGFAWVAPIAQVFTDEGLA